MIISLAATATLALAVVFTVAAVSKLVDQARTTAEFRDLGLPLPRVLARLVPLVEAATAVLLVAEPRLGGLAAAVLISAFTAVLIAVLRDGRTVSCGCLGALSTKPVSLWTVARNGSLLLLAAGASLLDALVIPDAAVVLASGSAILLATVIVQLLVLGNKVGSIWDVTLAGEQGREPDVVLDLEIDLDKQVERLVPTTVAATNRTSSVQPQTSQPPVSHPANGEV